MTNLKSASSRESSVAPWMIFSFLIWAFLFRGFILGKFSLSYDAIPYYEHTKLFIDHLEQGVMPLWDPTRNGGMPNEFFLRRIGEANPFYWIILICHKLGLAYNLSYGVFLSAYYALGLTGFYFLAKEILQDRLKGLIAFLLLMFSSLTGVLFRSFLMLLFTPMVWFFYFGFFFLRTREPFAFLGMIFSLMLLAITYVPYYFLLIFILVLGLTAMFYFKEWGSQMKEVFRFLNKNTFFLFLSIVILSCSLLPGWLFYQELKTGELVLPGRHGEVIRENALYVQQQSTAVGGLPVNQLAQTLSFQNRQIQIGDFYFPLFGLIALGLGMVCKLNRRLVVLFLLGFLVYILTLYDASRVYVFLYQHVFFFQYFRNFQFFLWLVLLPVLCLLAAEHFGLFLTEVPENSDGRLLRRIYMFGLHGLALGYFLWRQETQLSYYFCILASLGFLVWHEIKSPQNKSILFLWLWLIVAIPSLEAFGTIEQGWPKAENYRYDDSYREFPLLNQSDLFRLSSQQKQLESLGSYAEPQTIDLYAAVFWQNALRKNMKSEVLDYYMAKKLIAYDHVEWMDDRRLNVQRVGEAFVNNENLAFLSEKSGLKPESRSSEAAVQAEIITKESSHVELISFDTNSLEVKTNFPKGKFLVYNDSFYSGWRAFIDGIPVEIYRTNVAFKGVWVPQGEHTLYFRYGSFLDYFLKYFLIIMFGTVLIGVVILWGQYLKRVK